MFQIRRFSYRLWANKISSKASFSNWHSSNAIFGGQILQIQDCRHHWKFKNQQLTQRHQFCTEISSPIDDSANSSSPISSMAEMPTSIEQNEQPEILNGENSTSSISFPAETPTNIAKDQNEQHEIPIPDINKLYRKYFYLNNSNNQMLKLTLRKGKSGQKSFRVEYIHHSTNQYQFRLQFPNILVPEDAYSFFVKMDELIRELVDQKFIYQDNVGQSKQVKQRTVKMIGKHHKFQLDLFLFPNMNKNDSQKQLCIIRLCAVHLESNKLMTMFLPLEALFWLRENMVNMLIRHDGTETIEQKAPAKIPKQFLMDGLELKNKVKKFDG